MLPLVLNVWSTAEGCEAAGEVATAADYYEQAQRVFDELRLPSNLSLYPRQ